jgi:enamine deaminase RidA (YjgF/YER057c/UK114 family)
MAALLTICGVVAFMGAPAGQQASPEGVQLRRIGHVSAGGAAEAVIVQAGRLVHTALVLPPAGLDDAARQVDAVLARLNDVLRAAGTSLDEAVRLHVYVADAEVTPLVDSALVSRFAEGRRPAVTIVESRLPGTGARVAMDVVAATGRAVPAGQPVRLVADGVPPAPGAGAHAAIQPDGPFVVVSGRAATGNFKAAIEGTIAELRTDLAGVGLDLSHVVHVKSFLTDMSRADELLGLVAGAFAGTPPPQVVTEWVGGAAPAEIELVAVGQATGPTVDASAARVTFVEPVSARFSRVARVASGRPVYVSGLVGEAEDPAAQVDQIFAALQRLAAAAGSSMQRLVKATYYVADKGADGRINTIRPTIYAPESPPAASKISVRGVGRPGRAVAIDMIMVAGTQ